MKIQPYIARRIFFNVLVSLFIYALPVILMFITFYFNGQRPWTKSNTPKETIQPHRR